MLSLHHIKDKKFLQEQPVVVIISLPQIKSRANICKYLWGHRVHSKEPVENGLNVLEQWSLNH